MKKENMEVVKAMKGLIWEFLKLMLAIGALVLVVQQIIKVF